MYPKDNKLPQKAGRLRLMYEANPMALLVERAGGKASTGRERILEILPRIIIKGLQLLWVLQLRLRELSDTMKNLTLEN